MKENSFISFVLFFVLIALVGSAQADKNLNADEVKTLFSGKTSEWKHEKKGFTASGYFGPDGKLKGVKGGSKSFQVRWSVNDSGELCIHKRKGVLCRIIEKSGDVYKKYKIKSNGKRIHVVTYKSFVDGNPNKY